MHLRYWCCLSTLKIDEQFRIPNFVTLKHYCSSWKSNVGLRTTLVSQPMGLIFRSLSRLIRKLDNLTNLKTCGILRSFRRFRRKNVQLFLQVMFSFFQSSHSRISAAHCVLYVVALKKFTRCGFDCSFWVSAFQDETKKRIFVSFQSQNFSWTFLNQILITSSQIKFKKAQGQCKWVLGGPWGQAKPCVPSEDWQDFM